MSKPKQEDKKKIKIVIDGVEKEAEFRVFKSGREDYGCYGIIKINDYPYRISMNLIKM